MWGFDPVDLWAAVIIVAGYSLPFGALLLELKLQELRERAERKEIQEAIRRRQVTGI